MRAENDHSLNSLSSGCLGYTVRLSCASRRLAVNSLCRRHPVRISSGCSAFYWACAVAGETQGLLSLAAVGPPAR